MKVEESNKTSACCPSFIARLGTSSQKNKNGVKMKPAFEAQSICDEVYEAEFIVWPEMPAYHQLMDSAEIFC
jgi:hypothetical protein